MHYNIYYYTAYIDYNVRSNFGPLTKPKSTQINFTFAKYILVNYCNTMIVKILNTNIGFYNETCKGLQT